MNAASRSPAVVVTRTAGITWFALSALVILAIVSALVVAPNEGRLQGRPVSSLEGLGLVGYASLNAFVAFRLARLKRWAFIALPVVLLPWLLYAGCTALDFLDSWRR